MLKTWKIGYSADVLFLFDSLDTQFSLNLVDQYTKSQNRVVSIVLQENGQTNNYQINELDWRHQ